MGDITDMILEGELCEQCWEPMYDYEGGCLGFPNLCPACQEEIVNGINKEQTKS